MAVHDSLSDIGRGATGEAAIGLPVSHSIVHVSGCGTQIFGVARVAWGIVFPARDETASVPGNQNDSSYDD